MNVFCMSRRCSSRSLSASKICRRGLFISRHIIFEHLFDTLECIEYNGSKVHKHVKRIFPDRKCMQLPSWAGKSRRRTAIKPARCNIQQAPSSMGALQLRRLFFFTFQTFLPLATAQVKYVVQETPQGNMKHVGHTNWKVHSVTAEHQVQVHLFMQVQEKIP